MMKDWDNDDVKLLNWREETGNTNFEKTISSTEDISTSEYFDIAFLKTKTNKAPRPIDQNKEST